MKLIWKQVATLGGLLFLFLGEGWGQKSALKGGASFIYPIKAEKGIAGDFAELRANHFHSGMDFCSEEVEGKVVVASQKGWISRMSISPAGYGNALYIAHPDGHTSVYGHLKHFSKKLDSVASAHQYAKKSYSIDISLPPNAYPVKQGEMIAISGNTGASGGPHLHFEIRDTYTQTALNPMNFIPVVFPDDISPIIRRILIAPAERDGCVNGKAQAVKFKTNVANHALQTPSPITAWGRIQIAMEAIDRMNENYHTFAVPITRLFVDGKLISEINITRVDFRITPHFNALIYYPEFMRSKGLYLSSYKQPNSQMEVFKTLSKERGAVLINEERPYKIRYEAEDGKGNSAFVQFTIIGKRQVLPDSIPQGMEYFAWEENHIKRIDDTLEVRVPSGGLFGDMYFHCGAVREADSCSISSYYKVGDTDVALAQPAELIFTLPKRKDIPYEKVFIASFSDKGEKGFVSNRRRGRKVYGKIRKWGTYTLCVDTIAPVITPLSLTSSNVFFKLSDQGSGIKSFEASLDGEFLLLQPNVEKTRVCGNVPYKRFGRPKERLFRIEVKDFCDNISFYEEKVVF